MMLAIIMFGVGLISGMYISSQIEKSIDRNIEHPDEKAIRKIDELLEFDEGFRELDNMLRKEEEEEDEE